MKLMSSEFNVYDKVIFLYACWLCYIEGGMSTCVATHCTWFYVVQWEWLDRTPCRSAWAVSKQSY